MGVFAHLYSWAMWVCSICRWARRRYPLEVNQIRKDITAHARAYCNLIYDDPQTGQQDMCQCSLVGHCVAIDSPYTYAEKGRSICKRFNTFPPMQGIERGTVKVCAICHRQFSPTSNRQRVCAACGRITTKRAARERQQKARQNVTL